MGIFRSIIRFLCCRAQAENDQESGKSPLLVYQPNEDSSTFYAKGLLQKLPQPRKAAAADPILPIRNPAPIITISNGVQKLPLSISSPVSYYNDSPAATSSQESGRTTYAFLSEIDTDYGEASEYYCGSDEDCFTYSSSGDTIVIDHMLDWAILSAEVASANRLIKKILLHGKGEEEDQQKRQEEEEVITVKSTTSHVVVDESDEVVIRVNSSSEILPNTIDLVADLKTQDIQQWLPKTSSKKIENVLPSVEESKKIVKKRKGKKKGIKGEEATIVKSSNSRVVDESDEVVITVNSTSEIPPNTFAPVADFKTQDRQQGVLKTSSKKIEDVVPSVEESKKIVKKRKGKKRGIKEEEAIIVKSTLSSVVVDELDEVIRVNSTSEIPPNTFVPAADFKTQDRQQWLPKTSSKEIEDAVPLVGESKKIVKKGEGKKREIIMKSTTTSRVVDEERWIKHYSSHHRILLVGEGDFSFSACLAVVFGCAYNMTATSLDSTAFLKENYANAASNIEKLKSRGCKVMHGIDATKMADHPVLGRLKFDRIIFNFPFAGFFKNYLPRQDDLELQTRLVSMFMKNARGMIGENGEIHISHKTNGFHAEWELKSLGSRHNLRLIEAAKFHHRAYPGYSTKCGFGGNNFFNCNPSRTYKFGLDTV